jgi:hypothetical protein
LAGKPEEKRPFRRIRCRWKSGIKMDLDGVDGIYPAHERFQWRALVNTVMNLRVTKRGEFD